MNMEDAELNALIDSRVRQILAERQFLPILQPSLPADAPFMAYSTVAASDIMHPRFYALCKMMGMAPGWNRKLWEWVFIAHHIADHVRLGMRGLVFGVGTEPMPAMFASLGADVLATDAPDGEGPWVGGSQWSGNVERLRAPHVVDNAVFDQRVRFQPCDMTRIPEELSGQFDFTWSSCAFEHLGTLEAGMKFVIDSIKTLKPGGIAVHTTEFNLSSDADTVEAGDTVIYRYQDMQVLLQRLRAQGHEVQEFSISPTAHAFDTHVDAPPFSWHPHLKLRLAGYVTTSAGIVVRAGGG